MKGFLEWISLGLSLTAILLLAFWKMQPSPPPHQPLHPEPSEQRAALEMYYQQRAAKDELARLNKQVEQLVAQGDIARAEAIKQKARADALEVFLGMVLPGVKPPDAMIPPPVIPFPTKPVD